MSAGPSRDRDEQGGQNKSRLGIKRHTQSFCITLGRIQGGCGGEFVVVEESSGESLDIVQAVVATSNIECIPSAPAHPNSFVPSKPARAWRSFRNAPWSAPST
jgi:hypothetical protein